nr:PepSY-associated TM helix domain-containing protein [Granulicella sp. dw_53]
MRRAIFQIHLWIGVIVSLYCIVIGLSGSALVFKEEIERATEPELYHVAPAPRQTTLDQAIRRIEAERPGWRVSGLENFEQPQTAVLALMGRKDTPPNANYRAVSFNPYTGAVLRDRMRFDGVLGWTSNLHFYLLAGKTGLLISGGMALGLLLLCVSGLILWWPGVQRWAAALILRLHRGGRRVNWKRLNWDLHSVLGFWSCVALLAVTFTGLYFCFPAPVGGVTVLVTGGSIHKALAEVEAPDRKPSPSTRPIMTVDEAVAVARKALPAEAPAGYMSLPHKPGAAYSVTGYYKGALPFSQLVRVSLDPRTGEVLGYTDTTHQMRGLRVIQYFYTVHFGSFGGDGALGLFIKILWFLLGLMPALLAVTGLIMYWNRKLRPLLRTLST